MTRTQRILAVALSGALLLGGFAIGRVADAPRTNAEENQLAVNRSNATLPVSANGEGQNFYLSDFKSGYTDGHNAALDDRTPVSYVTTGRPGYNDGYKQGFADAYRSRAQQDTLRPISPVTMSLAPVPVSYNSYNSPVVSRRVIYRERSRRRGSKLKTALTIAAPAAIGAGIGLAAGGKKGAGIGALIGGGGGALYHLFKDR